MMTLQVYGDGYVDTADNDNEFVTPQPLDLNQYSDTIERNFATAIDLIDRTKEFREQELSSTYSHVHNNRKVRFGSNKFYTKRPKLKRTSISNPIVINNTRMNSIIQEEDSQIDQTMFDDSDNEDVIVDLGKFQFPSNSKKRRPLRYCRLYHVQYHISDNVYMSCYI